MFDFTSPPSPALNSGSNPKPSFNSRNRLSNLPVVACVLAVNLPVQVERATHPSGPLIIAHPLGKDTVYAASSDILRAGVKAGMAIYEAKKLAPLAQLIQPDEDEYHARHEAIYRALQDYSTVIETVGMGEFLLDIRGLERTYGGLLEVANGIHREAAAISRLFICVGVAHGKFTAQQAARYDYKNAITVVPPGQEAKFLSELPVSILPEVPGEMLRRLTLLDIHTLGQFASFRKPALLRQFGPQVSELYELARGNDPRPLKRDIPPLRFIRSKNLDDPIDNRRLLLNLVTHLSSRLSRALQVRGYHAEALKLTIVIKESGPIKLETSQTIKPPTADTLRLNRIVMQMLGKLNVSAAVTQVSLCAYPVRHWGKSVYQYALIRTVIADKQAKIEEVVQAIWQRFGEWAIKFGAFLGIPIPVKVKVRVNNHGWPYLVTTRTQTYRVMGIDEEWQEEGQWWSTPIRRYYFRVLLEDSSLRNVYKDLNTGEWYLDRAGFIL